VEEGLPKTQVLLWVYGEQLRAVLDNVVVAEYQVVSLHTADKYHRLTRRLSQDQKGLEGKAIMVSQQPSAPW
jgi:hypothetical protein